MAQLSVRDRAFLKEALSFRRRKNSFESALSKAVKSQDGSFEDYIRLMSQIRDRARDGEMEIHEAAKALLGPENDRQ